MATETPSSTPSETGSSSPAATPPAATPAAPSAPAPAAAPAAEAPPAPKAPATYALTVPAGGRLDDSDLKTFEQIARQSNWTQEEAARYLADEVQELDARAARYYEETKRDTDYGGEKLPDVQRRVNLILDRYRPAGTPRGDALRRELRRTGYENSIHFVSLMADIAKDADEDRGILSRARSPEGQPDLADRFYKHPSSQKLQEETKR
jgi:hypothetical protein